MNIILFLLLSGCTREGGRTNSLFPTLRMYAQNSGNPGAKGLNSGLKFINAEGQKETMDL